MCVHTHLYRAHTKGEPATERSGSVPTVTEPVGVGWATERPAASPAWGPLCPGAPHKWGAVQPAAGTGSWCPTEARAPGGSDQRPAESGSAKQADGTMQ